MNDRDYCYPPDFTVLRNKLDIRDSRTLDAAERQFVAQRLLEAAPTGDFDLARLMDPMQQTRLLDNTACAMQGVPEEIVRRQVAHFHRADPAYGEGVARRVGLDTLWERAA